MFELILILLGEPFIRGKWKTLFALGGTWAVIGTLFFVDAMIDEIRIAPAFFAAALLFDALVTFIVAFSGPLVRRRFLLAKCVLLLLISLLILFKPWGSGISIGILVGLALILDAGWRTVSAYLVRFASWQRSIAVAVFEFLLGLWSFVPWPTNWEGEVGMDVGMLIMVGGLNVVGFALRIKRLPKGTPVSEVLSEGWPSEDADKASPRPTLERPGKITVHVWTPTGGLAPLRRTVARYIAATDENGLISTGHSALESPPDIYISHYPAQEVDRTGGDFARALRASKENDIPGRWQPSYAVESQEWCPSSVQVEFKEINVGALRHFWEVYRADPTYNLTNRNCSSVVAKALDIAIEGAFAQQGRSAWFIGRLLLSPELWTAGMLRLRAMTMAWTPGLVLDYARSLSVILRLKAPKSHAGA